MDLQALFGSDDQGRPIPNVPSTLDRRRWMVNLTIDGVSGQVPQVVYKRDFLGNVIYGADGEPQVRPTTIYDAALMILKPEKTKERIPVLCHQEHVAPVGMCRMCCVQVARANANPARPPRYERKLVPACQHRVPQERDGQMWVITRGYQDGECGEALRAHNEDWLEYARKIKTSVQQLTKLLLGDHYHPSGSRDQRHKNELTELADDLGLALPAEKAPVRNRTLHAASRRQSLPVLPGDEEAKRKGLRYSSRTIEVDHDKCILCDRCVRGCAEVKQFNVIGHTGKGYRTRISFDLDQVMNDSTCVQCGECATACPTGALVFRRRVAPVGWEDLPRVPDPETNTRHSAIYADLKRERPTPDPTDGILTADEMQEVVIGTPEAPFRPFAGIPFAYLKWNEGAVRKRAMAGGYLCRQGDYASTAYLIKDGEYEICDETQGPARQSGPPRPENLRDRTHIILGEMACLNAQPRTRSIRVFKGGVIYEVKRNLLDMLLRTEQGRQILYPLYRQRAARQALHSSELYNPPGAMEPARLEAMRQALDQHFLRDVRTAQEDYEPGRPRSGSAMVLKYRPGQAILREGDRVDGFYIVHFGFVEFTRHVDGRDILQDLYSGATHRQGGRKAKTVRRGEYFGEIALMWDLLSERHRGLAPRPDGTRTASAIALDEVEVLWISQDAFRAARDQSSDLRAALIARSERLLEKNAHPARMTSAPPLPTRPAAGPGGPPDPRPFDALTAHQQAEYVRLGLYQGQKLLVFDLDRCTRCDECTRGCADSHGDGLSRLLREGERFDRFLVVTCCRSCHKPYCLDGCPVDAIHRRGTRLEVAIDNHCIGCGLCERNCPYGAIQMTQRQARVQAKAVNCDLCAELVPEGGDPFCVRSCPHDAAFRPDGEGLLDAVLHNRPPSKKSP